MIKTVVASLALAVAINCIAIAQVQQPAEYVIRLNPAEVELAYKGISKLPYEEVAQLVNKLRQQIIDQQKPIEPPKAEPK